MADYFVNKGDTTLVPHKLVSGQKNVTTPGTELQLVTADTNIYSVVIKAKAANTGIIYVGGDNTVSSTTGFALAAGESVSIEIDNLNKIWIDSSVGSEGVTYLYVTAY